MKNKKEIKLRPKAKVLKNKKWSHERKNICCVCKKRLTKHVTNKQRMREEIIWEGHYDTPHGLFCMDCYKPRGINRCPEK